jgi:uncharacterized protein (TIGR00297 family)
MLSKIILSTLIVVVLLFFSILSYKNKWLNFWAVVFGDMIIIALWVLSRFNVAMLFAFGIVFLLGVLVSEKHRTRKPLNIISKAFLPLVFLPFNLMISFASLAEALADTFAGEIGIRSKKEPRMIIGFQKVKAGTNGAVSFLGFFAAFLGSLIVALLYLKFDLNWIKFAIIIISAFCGTLIDSIFGVIQNKGFLNNEIVNFIGSLASVLIAFGLQILLL